jgi:hypothetical protein
VERKVVGMSRRSIGHSVDKDIKKEMTKWWMETLSAGHHQLRDRDYRTRESILSSFGDFIRYVNEYLHSGVQIHHPNHET